MTGKIKYLVLQGNDGRLDYADISGASFREYASRHGYGYHCAVFDQNWGRHGHASWQKLALMERIIAEGQYEWLLWTDADTVVTNHKARLDHRQAGYSDGPDWLLVSQDWNNYSPWSAGVMLMRLCPEALAFIREAAKRTEYRDSGCWDQSAMQEVWDHNREGIKILPRRILQSVPSDVVSSQNPWHQGDFIAHMTGRPQNEKRKYMEAYSARAIR